MIDLQKGKKLGKKVALDAQKVLIGTLRNMSPKAAADRAQAADQARTARDQGMIRENFGNEGNYRDAIGLDTPEGDALFTPWYTKLARSLSRGK